MDAYLELAQSRAGEAGDHVLLAEICCARGHLYSDSPNGSPYHDPKTAVALLEQANRFAADAPRWVRSHVAARWAEDRATANDAYASDEALDIAISALGDQAGPPMPAAGFYSTAGYYAHWDAGRLTGYEGTCDVLLGRFERPCPPCRPGLSLR